MTITAKAIDLKDKIYTIISTAGMQGISEHELIAQTQDEIVDDDAISLTNAIESLIDNNYIRAYYPENSFEYFFQVVKG